MTPHQVVPGNHLNRFPLDILLHVYAQLDLVCHELPLHLYRLPSHRLVCKYLCGAITPLVFRRMNFSSPRICSMLRSTPAELSNIFATIGQHVQDITIRSSDPSSRTEIDAALAAVVNEMPNLRTLTVIYDPLDTRSHNPLLGAFRQLRQLEHITLAEPPRSDWAPGWPIRLGHQEPTSQRGEGEAGAADPGTESNSESGSERAPDTDTEGETGKARLPGATKNLHSFRKLCLTAILQHHAQHLLSVRLQGSIPLDAHNYRRLRDRVPNLQVLQLVGAFECCSPGLVVAFAEDTRWACAGNLQNLNITGSSMSAISEALVMRQFRLGVFGGALDEPPSVSFGES